MPAFRKKPVEFLAFRPGIDETEGWFQAAMDERKVWHIAGPGIAEHFVIKTLEGNRRLTIGDWCIRGVAGEIYPCKPEIFAETYAPAEAFYDELTDATTIAPKRDRHPWAGLE